MFYTICCFSVSVCFIFQPIETILPFDSTLSQRQSTMKSPQAISFINMEFVSNTSDCLVSLIRDLCDEYHIRTLIYTECKLSAGPIHTADSIHCSLCGICCGSRKLTQCTHIASKYDGSSCQPLMMQMETV
jgi:hypothetical protein